MLDAFARLPVWQRALVFGVVALLLSVGWYFVFFADALEQTQAATAGLAKAKAELAEAEKDRANYAVRRQKVEDDERKLAEQREVLPLASATVDNLMQTFQEESRLVGMTVESWTNEPETIEEFSARMPIKVRATGSWPQLGDFFRRTSELPRIVSVEKLSLKLRTNQGTVASGDHPLLDAEFEAATYRFLSDAEREAAAQKGAKQKGRRRK